MEVTVELDDMSLIFEVDVSRDAYIDERGAFPFNVFTAESIVKIVNDFGDVTIDDRTKAKFFNKYRYLAEELAEENYDG